MRKMKRSCIKVQNMTIWRFDFRQTSENVLGKCATHFASRPQSHNAILAKTYYAF